MIDFKKFNSVISLTSYFTSDEKCKQAIIQSRWSDGDVVCPYCGGHHCVVRKDGKFRCKTCGKNFSCLVGTLQIYALPVPNRRTPLDYLTSFKNIHYIYK